MPHPDISTETLQDMLALRTALLDKCQASLNTNSHLFSDEKVWTIQAGIDEKRFDLELDRLSLNARLAK